MIHLLILAFTFRLLLGSRPHLTEKEYAKLFPGGFRR